MTNADLPQFFDKVGQTCEICSAKLSESKSWAQALGKPTEQPVWCCSSCGHIQVFPIPDEETINSYYEYPPEVLAKLGMQQGLRWRGGEEQATKTYTARLQKVQQLLPPGGTLLDVGYGSGSFLRTAYEAGFKVSGIERDTQHFKPQFPCEIFEGKIEDNLLPAEEFDIVSAHHILEHVVDLEEALGAIYHTLKPGGYLLIELPHEIRSLVNRIRRVFRPLLFQPNYSYITSYQHFRFFNPQALDTLLTREGFKVISCRSIPASCCLTGLGVLALLPLRPIEQLLDWGHFQEAIAQKPKN
jgi:2-polyprenyl-3-methyl-5-hydroxy-6-metoxy-1,4-benzoquinol methylase